METVHSNPMQNSHRGLIFDRMDGNQVDSKNFLHYEAIQSFFRAVNQQDGICC